MGEDGKMEKKRFSPHRGQGLNETEPWLRTGGFREPAAGRDGEGSSWKARPPGGAGVTCKRPFCPAILYCPVSFKDMRWLINLRQINKTK